MNVLEGRVEGDGDAAVFVLAGGGRLPLAGVALPADVVRATHLGVRPEHLLQADGAEAAFSPLVEVVEPMAKAHWIDGQFSTVYHPPTGVLISGQGVEAERLEQLARAADFAVVRLGVGESCERLIDPFTAVVMLHHDLEAEHTMIDEALHSRAFYIGALGSIRTHRKRVEGLRARGWNKEDIGRIKAPIGLFGPTRDSTSLALSVLSDIAASRLVAFG
jgi:xanthine dehydrogenase accessory factor